MVLMFADVGALANRVEQAVERAGEKNAASSSGDVISTDAVQVGGEEILNSGWAT